MLMEPLAILHHNLGKRVDFNLIRNIDKLSILKLLFFPDREKLQNPTDDDVVKTEGNVTTSKGPGTALKFALELGEQLFGKEAREKIQAEMLV